ncbi:hypothetical protein J7E73_14720 [Paenibacillus albidus]|uniref:hypothetical protein n=1 Tax=Paenibacillus albidus TaxID=2041023 RepID=UPI001BEA8327|nr:hypothetical protein [Paenibacillus albidus]MBT2290372.1 hypothetical protein [Paenibacillus albidus]
MTYAFSIKPQTYMAFDSEEVLIDQCKEWGLLSEKATKSKTFYYKGNGLNVPCSIIGLVDDMTAVIQLDNGQQHCIHPSYLKEMQAASYGSRSSAAAEPQAERTMETPAQDDEGAVAEVSQERQAPISEASATEQPKAKATRTRTPKIELPEGKVKLSATVKEFTTVPNHFSDNDDEIVVYEAVSITETEPEVALGEAWSSYSATLKKQELEVGDQLTFEAKIVKKKLTKHPVPYKINNPAKIKKTAD